ncbi:MAG: hypothetical protein KDE04_19420 [Anaerolineales bacterium]|nr:hypothetical protein [Anaerolineales bacterium]
MKFSKRELLVVTGPCLLLLFVLLNAGVRLPPTDPECKNAYQIVVVELAGLLLLEFCLAWLVINLFRAWRGEKISLAGHGFVQRTGYLSTFVPFILTLGVLVGALFVHPGYMLLGALVIQGVHLDWLWRRYGLASMLTVLVSLGAIGLGFALLWWLIFVHFLCF